MSEPSSARNEPTFPAATAVWAFLRTQVPLATIIGYVVCLLPLVGIFGGWGLPFTQLVDLRDVLLPGFVFAVIAFLAGGLIYTPGLIADLAFNRVPLKSRAIATLVIQIASGLIWMPIFGLPLWAKVTAAIGAMAVTGQFFLRIRDYRVVALPLLIPVMMFASTVTAVWLGFARSEAEKYFVLHGFVGELWVARSARTPCDGQVLWLGEKSVVLRCAGDQAAKRRIRVLTSKVDLTLSPLQPAASPVSAARQTAHP